jgi:hypothetical protein
VLVFRASRSALQAQPGSAFNNGRHRFIGSNGELPKKNA